MRALAAQAAPLALLLFSAGCATAPKYGPADDQALDPIRLKYQDCIGHKTAEYINGSDDVPFLVNTIVRQCDPELKPVQAYLAGRKFSPYFIQSYLNDVRSEASDVTASFILKAKGAQAGQPYR